MRFRATHLLVVPLLLAIQACSEPDPTPSAPASAPAPTAGVTPPPVKLPEQGAETKPPATSPPPAQEFTAASATGLLEYPRDATRVIARVEDKDLTLGDLVQHITTRHDPDFKAFVSTQAGNLYFQPPHTFGPDWTRHFADVIALQAEAESRGRNADEASQSFSDALKRAFEAQLAVEQQSGSSIEWNQDLVNIRLAKYQREHGLETEVQGWLDFLVTDQVSEQELYDYYGGNARIFGGRVTFAHILIRHRDPVTLVLLDEQGRRAAWEKIADARARLKPDGSNFAEVAALVSDDRRTAERGGKLEFVTRFDRRLPAALCRAAWALKDEQVSDPIESPYGLHLLRRLSFLQHEAMLYTDGAKPTIRETRRKHLQEELLFAVRERRRIELRY